WNMTGSAQQIFKEALKLSPTERATLIEKLFHSFDSERQREIDSIWAEEVESRIDAHDSGKLKAVHFDSVFEKINKR
ncbi:MAG: addiction module protein, partial [Desulfosalsimonadaceae bacterium]|nr:addiction module protein [Desulfosalsimonadaceae bacterium]